MRAIVPALVTLLLAGVPAGAMAANPAPPSIAPLPLAGGVPAAKHKGRGHHKGKARRTSRRGRPRRTLSGVLNLNQASTEQLGLFPGLGKEKVQAVIAARPFAAVWEVGKVRGVGAAFFRKYEEHLRVDGPTTLTWLTASP